MSYILEALKKSQQERELGLEPALSADTPAVGRGGPALGRHAWGYVSLALAAAAIMISLYGLVQGRFSQPSGASGPVPSEAASGPADVGRPPPASAPAMAASGDQVPKPSPVDAVSEAPVRSDPEPAAPPQELTPASEEMAPARVASPRTDPGSGGGAPPGSTQARSGSVVGAVPPAAASTPTPSPELATVRQPTPKRAEAAAAQPASADADPVAPPRPVAGAPAPSQAPQRRVSELAAAVERRIEASPAPAPAIGSDLDRAPVLPPRKLPPGPSQLPPAVFRELPQARVLVHVYVEQPAQRFVILNSRKLREGDASPEGLQMEEIVPEGVILSFQGHRFFIPR